MEGIVQSKKPCCSNDNRYPCIEKPTYWSERKRTMIHIHAIQCVDVLNIAHIVFSDIRNTIYLYVVFVDKPSLFLRLHIHTCLDA